MKKLIVLVYGAISYLIGMTGLFFLISLLQGWVSTAMSIPDVSFSLRAALINISLLLLFSIQHSYMAHHSYKDRFNLSPAAERATYVLFSGVLMILLFLYWQPLPHYLWQLPSGSALAILLLTLGWIGWLIVFASTFMVSHADLFGLRQSWLQWKQKPYTPLPFKINIFYALCRHPIMAGFLLAFWATPDMTSSRILFAAGMTIYILIGIHLEEKGLQTELGEPYIDYCQRTPKLIPQIFHRHKNAENNSRRQ
ncbi:methyltransferase family protein [Yersinia hibernica]|uniref:Isoprenylcysteine carboxylmethyltransferase family protein n=1 Tax=Yersinia enterocolitica LC20 TaxID=1443113 RepID=A0A7U4GFE1_YEREN|nr:isoprenylcysteine carboxylmethyltransferase family protein [Yersinia hibernica]AHM73946.1 isoprenylcysteine carboxylmethyltransferase family protein [Yersinia hibernica]OVZ79810.1 hypothetical protein CBW54_19265 [Yersinia kristensenii]